MVGAASVSVEFFLLHNILGYTELNVDTTKNHPAITYFANPSIKNAVLLEIPLSSQQSNTVSIVTSACAMIFKPAIFVCRERRTHHLVTVMYTSVLYLPN